MNVIFAGTPEFAVPTLQALIDSHHEVVAVYTQPDRPAGRGRQLAASPVKQCALAHDIPVFQPKTLRDQQAQQTLAAHQADVMVVVAYGLILPAAVLQAPKQGCINVHGSLLPRWRGAAPIQRAVLAGDAETGVTIMQMDEGLDTGPMLRKVSCAINATDTSHDLYQRLAPLGADALLATLSDIEQGQLQAQAQDDAQATHAAKLNKADAVIDWQLPAAQIDRNIRGYFPWPVATFALDDLRIKVHEATVITQSHDYAPGTIVAADKNGIDVACGSDVIRLTCLQFPGKKALSAHDILNAHKARFQPDAVLS